MLEIISYDCTHELTCIAGAENYLMYSCIIGHIRILSTLQHRILSKTLGGHIKKQLHLIGASPTLARVSKICIPYLVVHTFDSVTDCGH